MKRFEDFHPAAVLIYYISAIVPAMLVSDVWLVLISWLVGILWLWVVKHRFPIGNIVFTAAAVCVMGLVNALVSHDGTTELLFINGKAITLEAVRYGGLTGLMLAAVIIWFASFSDIMTSDKIIALFGRLPKLGLVVSMVLRLVPEYIARFGKVRKAVLVNSGDEFVNAPAEYMRLMSAVFTWALENSMQTADSMQMRGYASGARRYSPYRFKTRDGVLIAVIILMQLMYFAPYALRIPLAALNCALPLIYEGKEWLKWVFFKSTL